MGRFRQGYVYIFLIGLGVIGATILANRLFASGLVSYQVLYESVQKGWKGILQKSPWASVQIILIRSLETAGIWLICKNRKRNFPKACLLVLGGCTIGLSLSMLTWNLGPMGLICFVAVCMPHYLLYIPVWAMMVVEGSSGSGGNRRRFFSGVIGLLTVGILLEIFINPLFLRFFG